MSWKNFRNFIGDALKELIDESTRAKIEDIIRKNVLPFVADEFNLFIDDFFPEIKEKVEVAILVTIREAIKKELVPDFDNQTLNIMAERISNSILNTALPRIMDRIKEDLLTEEFIIDVLMKILTESSKASEKSQKEPENKLQNKKLQNKEKKLD